jgi:hypothetical protein
MISSPVSGLPDRKVAFTHCHAALGEDETYSANHFGVAGMVAIEDSRDTAHKTVPVARRHLHHLVELLVGQCERHVRVPISDRRAI